MNRQLTSGRDGNDFPRQRIGSNSAVSLSRDLGVRPGESDPVRMLCAVLLLSGATIVMVLALVWWLV